VTRGPSLDPHDKRLAVEVEDHPLEYGDFEGTIPKGEYGGGTVIVWDRGTWKPVFDYAKGYKKGHLEIELSGEKLKGVWHLVRMARKPREKRVTQVTKTQRRMATCETVRLRFRGREATCWDHVAAWVQTASNAGSPLRCH
jgi:DNA ligase D-like protein (predicted 3'-phosphoesterase)